MKTFPTPYFVRLLLDSHLVGTRVSTRFGGAPTALPAATVTLIGDSNPLDEWSNATAQVDVWAATEEAAGTLAWDLAEHWRTLPAQDVDGVAVAYAWVEQSPRPFEDDTSTARYLMELGLTLHKEPTDG